MIGHAARIARLSPADRRMAAEAVLALGLAALVVAVCPFRWIAGFVRFPERAVSTQSEPRCAVARVRWAVSACSRRVPWRAKCLEQALAAQWMLRRRSVPAVIHYGIVKRVERLAAHAWVSAGSTPVIGFENADEFGEIAQFPSQYSRDSNTRPATRFALLRKPRL
jgi:hypothetical protein